MKIFLVFCFFITIPAFAGLDGVYKNTFQKNGYICELNADLVESHSSFTVKKWLTKCVDENGEGPATSVNGETTFTFLDNKQVKISSSDDVSIYNVKEGYYKENDFYLNYEFESFLDGYVLKYEVILSFKLEKNVLNYTIKYLQNDQLIFNDTGAGFKQSL